MNYGFESCRIVPRPYSQNRFLGELSPLMPPDLGPFRVTIAIYLKGTPSGDLVSWLQGQGAPAGYIDGVELIKIQAAQQYEYRRLAPKQFRLIQLLHGRNNDRLIGTLITVNVTSAPQYVALSYVWDQSEEGQDPPLFLLDDTAIQFRPDLDSAMRALRRHDQDIHIWIDILCINQNDDAEKKMQIPQIFDIYHSSDSVAV